MSCCRIEHPASGAIAECQDERSYEQNKRKAFLRLIQKPEFQNWHKVESAKRMGILANAQEYADREMENIKVEAVIDGKWTEIQ